VFGPWRSGTAGATSVVAASLTETMCAP
jgi:hypothetical protein